MHIGYNKHEREELRKHLWSVIHYGRGLTGHAFEFALVILILLSLAILPLELIPAFSEFHDALAVIEVITTSIFTVEYALRVYAAPSRVRYIFSFYGIVDLLSILPFYIGLLGTQYLRAFRLIRLVRLGEIEAAAAEEEDSTMEHDIGLAEGEKVEWVVTRHPVYLFYGCMPPLLAITSGLAILLIAPDNPIIISIAVSLFLFAMIFLWKAWLDFSYDVIYITSRRLIFQNQHLVGRSVNQVNYHTISNVKPYYPSFISYIMRYGSLIIETPAAEIGRIELHIVRDHEKAAHAIMNKCVSGNEKSSPPPSAA